MADQPDASSLHSQAVEILRENRTIAIATNGLDGWPHCTMVGYANDGVAIFFVISKTGRKFANIGKDARVSIMVGRDVIQPESIKALSIAARAAEVTDERERNRAIDLLVERRPSLKRLARPDFVRSGVMVARPTDISLLDYSKGFGHSVNLSYDDEGNLAGMAEKEDDWGYGALFKPVS